MQVAPRPASISKCAHTYSHWRPHRRVQQLLRGSRSSTAGGTLASPLDAPCPVPCIRISKLWAKLEQPSTSTLKPKTGGRAHCTGIYPHPRGAQAPRQLRNPGSPAASVLQCSIHRRNRLAFGLRLILPALPV
ncbi:hypothetical protein GY45DRAFT_911216 [Cubamyces sp. BRFM 1775]|nr:hypothetical protein GY45DRAFT_911216 [Cubamyces sp. BRFM 1775]